jgi:hypothetical protein
MIIKGIAVDIRCLDDSLDADVPDWLLFCQILERFGNMGLC